MPVYHDGKWIEKLRRGKFDLAFNMCEGIDGIAALESAVISVLELFKIPFTGASSYTTAVCLRKHVVNGLLEKAGLPVPRFAAIRRGDPLVERRLSGDRQAGRRRRVARRRAAVGRAEHAPARRARRRDARALGRGARPALHRRPRGERRHPRRHGAADRRDRLQPHAARSLAHRHVSIEVGDRQRRRPRRRAALSRRDCRRRSPNEVRRVALRAWKLSGGFGYGRVDMRIDANGQPWILEVNANPDIAPDAGLARMARVAGIEYPPLIRNICELALARARESSAARRVGARAKAVRRGDAAARLRSVRRSGGIEE